jgi:aryl-alcohol dehydrogenase-like predicted oxidoreductase
MRRTASTSAVRCCPQPRRRHRLADLQQEGLIRHLGMSGVTSAQSTEAQSIAPVPPDAIDELNAIGR